jgi:hypothetical protein
VDETITMTLSELEARVDAIYKDGKRDAARALHLWLKERAEAEWKAEVGDESPKVDRFAWAAKKLAEGDAQWLHDEWVDHIHKLRQDGICIALREVTRIVELAPEVRALVVSRLTQLGRNIRAYGLYLMGSDPFRGDP